MRCNRARISARIMPNELPTDMRIALAPWGRRVASIRICAAGLLLAIAVAACAAPNEQETDAPRRVVLDNGVKVLFYPVPRADWAAVAASYTAGFVEDPRGRPQLAHLVEHLMCRCATASWKPEESFNLLASKGDVNAETLPTFMYLYATVPSADLDLALRVAAERMTSLKITTESIRAEGPKCSAEVGYTERMPQRMLGKFGLMALNQAWQYDQTEAKVKTGLDSTPPAVAARLHAALQPRNLTVVIVGGFQTDATLALVRSRLGTIRATAASLPAPDYSHMPKAATISWDGAASAVCIAFPPPSAPGDRLALTYWGYALVQKLMRSRKLMALADEIESSNQLFPVGPLPFYISATAKPGTDLTRLRRALIQSVSAAIAARPDDGALYIVHGTAAQEAIDPPLSPEVLRRQAAMYVSRMGMDSKRAIGAALTQSAIDLTRREQTLGPDRPTRLREIQSLSADQLGAILRRSLRMVRMSVILLRSTPAGGK